MAKIIFKNFKDASIYAKELAIATKTTVPVHKDGNIWWVEGQREYDKDESEKDKHDKDDKGGYPKLLGGYWRNRDGSIYKTQNDDLLKNCNRTRNIYNTETAVSSRTDGDNNYE